MMINGSVNQKDITIILNVYILNIRASIYMKQKVIELKKDIDKSIVIDGDFNILLGNWQNKYTKTQ